MTPLIVGLIALLLLTLMACGLIWVLLCALDSYVDEIRELRDEAAADDQMIENLRASRLVTVLELRRTRRERDAARAEARLLMAVIDETPIPWVPFAEADESTPIHDAVRGVG